MSVAFSLSCRFLCLLDFAMVWIEISGDSGTHSFNHLDRAAVFSEAGGEDRASLTDPDSTVRLTGDWNVAP